VNVRTFLPTGSAVTLKKPTVNAPAGWNIAPSPAQQPPLREPVLAAARCRPVPNRLSCTCRRTRQITQPYYLKQPRTGDVYKWADTDPKALPFDPPMLTASVPLTIGGIDVTVTRPVQFRYADDVRGELRRDINIVPRVAVGLDTQLLVVPLGSTPNQQKIIVRATGVLPVSGSGSAAPPITGMFRLRLPQGWTSTPAQAPFTLKASGDSTSTPFVVTAPARRTTGRFAIEAEATVGGATFSRDMQVVAYPHIQTHRLYWPATTSVQVFDLKVAPVKLGYIMGSGDEVPDAIRRMGVDVTMLDGAALATGDLSRFDTIVVGIRASETNPTSSRTTDG
jgi:hypothetical protein